jgi:hypothetical protein
LLRGCGRLADQLRDLSDAVYDAIDAVSGGGRVAARVADLAGRLLDEPLDLLCCFPLR